MSRLRIVAPLCAAILIVTLLVAAQIALPTIAAQHVRDQLKGSGRVLSVSVSAFPAVELLWHDADSVTVRMATYHSGTSHLTSLLDQSSGVGTLHASVGVLTDGLLTLHDAALVKHGNTLTGSADVALRDIRTAIPELTSLTPAASTAGALTFDATVSALGFAGTVPVTVQVRNGGIVAAADIVILPLSFNVFSDPRVSVESLGARRTSRGFAVTARGVLH